MRRVVVTGMGIVSPLGVGVEHVWKRLLNAESGLSSIQSCDVSDLPCKIAGSVPLGDKAEGNFNANDYVPTNDQKKIDPLIILAIAGGQEAEARSGWAGGSENEKERTGGVVGAGISGWPRSHKRCLR